MPCEDCAKHFAAVPGADYGQLRDDVRAIGWAVIGLWSFVLLILLALVRKGALAWADLLVTGG